MQLLRRRTEIRRKLSMNAAAAELPSFLFLSPILFLKIIV